MAENILNDYFEDVALGLKGHKSVVYKFGTNPNVGTTEVPIWDGEGAYTYLTATFVHVSGNSAVKLS